MHPLRVILMISLAIAVAVAAAFGWALHRTGVPVIAASILGSAAFVAFMVPWTAVFAWAIRRASDFDRLIDRTRATVADGGKPPIIDRPYHDDIDELARCVEELREAMLREKAWSEEQRATLQQIAAALGEGILALSPRKRVVLANDRVREMFGGPAEPVGKTLLEIIRNESLVAAFERAMEGQPSTDRITVGRGAAARQIEIRVFPVATSTEVAAVGLFIDVTTIERLQRVRQEFLDDFSHEVRTPLAGLRSAVETFQDGGLTAADDEHLRGIMLRQLARIERLVTDLSDLHRIESGDLVLNRQNVDLQQMLDELVDEFKRREGVAGSAIAVRGGPATVVGDPVRLQQIFANLIDNAWKHGGRSEVLIEIERELNTVVIKVSDRGEGIPAEEIGRIFNRFYRVDKSRSQSVPGVGLGLAITKHLVAAHGGSIRAFNRAGGGATFEVSLSAAAQGRALAS